jgi:hypothetical protein
MTISDLVFFVAIRPIYGINFSKIYSPQYLINGAEVGEEIRTYQYDLRKMLTDNALKDIADELNDPNYPCPH